MKFCNVAVLEEPAHLGTFSSQVEGNNLTSESPLLLFWFWRENGRQLAAGYQDDAHQMLGPFHFEHKKK